MEALYAAEKANGRRDRIDEVLIMTGRVCVFEAEARRRGVKVETISNRPKTLASNMARVRVGSASIAGASYTVQAKIAIRR